MIVGGILKDRGVYDAFKEHGAGTDAFSPLGRHIVGIVGEYYELDSGARSCPIEVIRERMARTLTNPKHVDSGNRYLGNLPSEVSGANVIHDIREHKRSYIGDKLSLALANRSPEVEGLLESYNQIQAASTHVQASGAKAEIVDVFDTQDLTEPGVHKEEHLIKLWPKALNDRCDGGAKLGHHILIFARPENGKTLVAINMVAGFLHQNLDVLYIANEEPSADVRQRIRQRLLKVSKQVVREKPQWVAEELRKMDLGGLRIAPLSPGTFFEIRKLVEEFNPSVLVIDQLRNIRVAAGTRTDELEVAATEARNMGKRHGLLVVSLTQAGDSATNKVSLELNDVDSSKTGIPAQMDLMVGVGSTEAMRNAGILSFSLPKNKLSGVHETFQCTYNKQTGVIH